MPETEVRAAQAIYDRERDLTDPDLGSSGRHRRPAADWGGDELFSRGPRRRGGRGGDARRPAERPVQVEAPRGVVRAERATGAADPVGRPGRAVVIEDRAAAWERPPGALAPDARMDAAWDRPPGARPSAPPAAAVPPEPAQEPRHEPIVGGRRTVLITGRPGTQRTGTPWALPSTERRRPPRTMDERVGARPDRVAAWAFGLGLLLILIAVSTADAATLL
jgi:hypothetical protein